MESILNLIDLDLILTGIVSAITAGLVIAFTKLREKVKESPNKLDDKLLEAMDEAIKKSKENKDG